MSQSETKISEAVTPDEQSSLGQERRRLERAGTMHWLHWLVVALSVVLTLFAWNFSKQQLKEKSENQFNREAKQIFDLVVDRMDKYEDSLWGSVGMLVTHEGSIQPRDWYDFVEALRVEERYPGIRGIGVADYVNRNELPAYLERQRRTRPGFTNHPDHDKNDMLVVTHIDPEKGNEKAIGLDLAHESNRYQAAINARDTGDAQITGPINLVQDENKTPAFLFFAPFYRERSSEQLMASSPEILEHRREQFHGIVSALFVVRNLMRGVLSKQQRHVNIRITDGGETIFDELISSEPDYDSEPLFTKQHELPLYGRNWAFTIWSGKSFRAATKNNQPSMILIAGIFIDSLLFILFALLSRANRRAVTYADRANHEVRVKALSLERSNKELEQFSYLTSHDLQEPLRTITSSTRLLHRRYGEGKLDEQANRSLHYLTGAASRMQALITGLLQYSRIGAEKELVAVDCNEVLTHVLADLEVSIKENDASIESTTLPTVTGDAAELRQLFQNLIANALKFRKQDVPVQVHISVTEKDDKWVFSVRDNGIGLEEKYRKKIFIMFQRLHLAKNIGGSGIGLGLCKKIVESHGGTIWVDSQPGDGSTFFFTLPNKGVVDTDD